MALLPPVDKRPEPRQVVGAVRNGFGMRLADVVTSDDTAAWTATALTDELRREGVRVVDAGPGIPLVGAELHRASTEAYYFYSGDVVLRAWLRRDDSVPYNAFVRGHGSGGTNWAATEAGYGAALTAAMGDAVRQVARDVADTLRQQTAVGPQAAEAGGAPRAAPPLEPPPAPPEPAALTAKPRAAPSRPVDFHLSTGLDFGLTTAGEIVYEDGSRQALQANGGAVWGIGATFLKVREGLASTRLTVGLKYRSIAATNGALSYLAFPVEAVEQLNLGPVRLGAGLSLSLAPGVSGSGVLAQVDERYHPSLGLLLEARWVFRFGGSLGQGLGLGPRILWQRVQSRGTSLVTDASAVGLAIDWTI